MFIDNLSSIPLNLFLYKYFYYIFFFIVLLLNSLQWPAHPTPRLWETLVSVIILCFHTIHHQTLVVSWYDQTLSWGVLWKIRKRDSVLHGKNMPRYSSKITEKQSPLAWWVRIQRKSKVHYETYIFLSHLSLTFVRLNSLELPTFCSHKFTEPSSL